MNVVVSNSFNDEIEKISAWWNPLTWGKKLSPLDAARKAAKLSPENAKLLSTLKKGRGLGSKEMYGGTLNTPAAQLARMKLAKGLG